MTTLKADPTALLVAAGALEANAVGIEADLEALSGRLDVLSTEWSGQARDAYLQAQSEWLVSMSRMTAILDGAARTLDDWAVGLIDIEKRLSAAWPS